jgi:FK506-binding protein 1
LASQADVVRFYFDSPRSGQVIKGWDEGVPQLSLGQKANLICTPDYAYGPRGYPPVIPANATLKFEVELLAINGKSS